MRIVSGAYGGRKLNIPKGRDIRPTSDKIRGAIFNMLQSRDAISDANVLDAFCGTGALGLEALSRGAAHASFFDKSRESLLLAKSNAENLGAENVDFKRIDATKLAACPVSGEPFNLVFLDPPYHKGLIAQTLSALVEGEWICTGAWVLCESEKDLVISLPDGFIEECKKTYGDIQILLLKYQPIAPE